MYGEAAATCFCVTRSLHPDPASGPAAPDTISVFGRFIIAQEKKRNPRLGQERTLEEFKNIMANLNLPYPHFIDYAVPGNKLCGVCPGDLPEDLEKYCRHMSESPQG
jgi:hypothetical protein